MGFVKKEKLPNARGRLNRLQSPDGTWAPSWLRRWVAARQITADQGRTALDTIGPMFVRVGKACRLPSLWAVGEALILQPPGLNRVAAGRARHLG